MSKEDFINGFMWGVTYGQYSAIREDYSRESAEAQAEYEWKIYVSDMSVFNEESQTTPDEQS